jgi:hypothetical protein
MSNTVNQAQEKPRPMSRIKLKRNLPFLLAAGFALSACVSNPPKGEDSSSSIAEKTSINKSKGIPPGMNTNGEVVNSSEVEGGHGKSLKGIGGWEGEVTGKPFRHSKFTKLKIGMPMKQVTDLIGKPTDQGTYVTGKAWIPFYFGSDRYRHELVYKNQGRLIFAGGSVGDFSSGHLVWIIYNRNEPSFR